MANFNSKIINLAIFSPQWYVVFPGWEAYAIVFNCASCVVCVLLEVFFTVLSSAFILPLRPHTELCARVGELLSAFGRRDHCWSHFPYFGEEVEYASFLLYVFSGSPGGQLEGGYRAPLSWTTGNTSIS